MKVELEFAQNRLSGVQIFQESIRMSHKDIRAPQIIPRINILLDQMNLCEKIQSKRLDLKRITSIFNKNQRDRLGSKSVIFPHLDHPILIIDARLGYQQASISCSEDNASHVSLTYCIFCDVKRHKM